MSRTSTWLGWPSVTKARDAFANSIETGSSVSVTPSASSCWIVCTIDELVAADDADRIRDVVHDEDQFVAVHESRQHGDAGRIVADLELGEHRRRQRVGQIEDRQRPRRRVRDVQTRAVVRQRHRIDLRAQVELRSGARQRNRLTLEGEHRQRRERQQGDRGDSPFSGGRRVGHCMLRGTRRCSNVGAGWRG